MADEDGFRDATYRSEDGLKLHARIYGESAAGTLPVVCLPGLTRNARDFHGIALFLSQQAARKRKVVAFDYRGRGQSDYDPKWKNYNVATEAADIVAGMAALGIDHAAFIGTSRGGLILHVMTATRPAAIKAVILNDIGPVLEGEGLAQIRAYLERSPKPRTMEEAMAVQRAAHGPAFPALSDQDWANMVEAIYRTEKGRPVADFDPKLLKTLKGLDLSRPLPQLWPQFEAFAAAPMMVIRGANSKLLSPATVEEMVKRHPGAIGVTVEGQGHPPMLETGDLPTRIAAFLDSAEAGLIL